MVLVRHILNRVIDKKKNLVCFVCGETGSGKSYLALFLAEHLDPKFDVDRVVFHAKDFLKVVKKSLYPGAVIVWDEVGVEYKSVKWYEDINQMISDVFQTFRNKNLIVFMTTPDKGFVDSKGRKLSHMLIHPLRIDFKKKRTYATVHRFQFSPLHGKMYHHNLRATDGVKISSFCFGLPSQELIKAYEKKKNAFNKFILERAEATIMQMEEDRKVRRGFKEVWAEIEKTGDYEKFKHKGNYNLGKIMIESGCGRVISYMVKVKLEEAKRAHT